MDIHYLDPNPAGHPAVLLLHGLGANAASWTLQFAPLIEAGFRPLAVDAPGFGGSRYDGRGWRIEQVAAAHAALLDSLHIPSAHVVGISMGGVIAQQFALDHPRRTEKLVLVNTFAVMKPTSLSSWLYLLIRMAVIHTLGMTRQARIVAQRVFPHPEQAELRQQFMQQVEQADPRAYRAAMHAMIRYDATSRLAELKMPTLIITGEQDTTVPQNNQHLLAENILGARQVTIPGAGHAASVDSYEAFNRELLGFLVNA
jgi:pimeloyl-ACP methyl ester carboxylesterase